MNRHRCAALEQVQKHFRVEERNGEVTKGQGTGRADTKGLLADWLFGRMKNRFGRIDASNFSTEGEMRDKLWL